QVGLDSSFLLPDVAEKLFVEEDDNLIIFASSGPDSCLDLFFDEDKKAIIVRQHVNYRYRCTDFTSDLGILNLKEYCEMISVVKKTANYTGLQKLRSATYEFDPKHVLAKTHVQRVRQQHYIGVLSGASHPLPPPGPLPNPDTNKYAYQRWMARADRFAAYCGTLLFPWDQDGDCKCHDWCTLVRRVRDEWLDPNYNLQYFIKASRLRYLRNLGNNLRVNHGSKKIIRAWRMSCADVFSAVDRVRNAGSIDVAEGVFADQLAVAKAIDLIQTSSAVQRNSAICKQTFLRDAFLKSIESVHENLFPSIARNLTQLPAIDDHLCKFSDFDDIYTKDWADSIYKILKDKTVEEEVAVSSLSNNNDEVVLDAALDKLREGLNKEQRVGFNCAVDKIRSGNQLLLFVHGPPGTGKTHLARSIMKAAKLYGIVFQFCAQSGAAAKLGDGVTLHWAASMGIYNNRAKNLRLSTLQKIHKRIGGTHAFCLDEISLISPSFFWVFSERIRLGMSEDSPGRDKHFGGKHVL
ncbi:MAG: AAA family ATPase, partial [Psychroserpens sp.]|nr:AAA family ATPase [Psychroserpens sp.]